MIAYWREVRRGQRLVLATEEGGEEEEIGGVRETKRGFDAFAKTFGYDPGRAMKGMGTLEEAKEFVESFRPWDLYDGGQGLSVDPQVRPLAGEPLSPSIRPMGVAAYSVRPGPRGMSFDRFRTNGRRGLSSHTPDGASGSIDSIDGPQPRNNRSVSLLSAGPGYV